MPRLTTRKSSNAGAVYNAPCSDCISLCIARLSHSISKIGVYFVNFETSATILLPKCHGRLEYPSLTHPLRLLQRRRKCCMLKTLVLSDPSPLSVFRRRNVRYTWPWMPPHRFLTCFHGSYLAYLSKCTVLPISNSPPESLENFSTDAGTSMCVLLLTICLCQRSNYTNLQRHRPRAVS